MEASAPSPASVRRPLAPALGVALVAYALVVLRFDFVCDDAYISFRYARRLIEGLGLRFNAGESPPVEGYTNLLWVLWLAPFRALGVDLGLAARLSSVACGAVALILTVRLAARRLELGPSASLACALFLATLPPFAVWSTGGLETMAFALAVLVVFERLTLDPARPRAVTAAAAALAAVWLRADGALWVGMALLAALAGTPREGWSRSLRAVIGVGVATAIGVAAQAGFRLAYHDEWIPNTARVKAGFSTLRLERGAKYLASLLVELPFLALAPLAAVAWRRARSRLAWQALVVVLLGAAYAVFVGGDFMAMGRFLVPTLPFVALGFAALVAALPRAGGLALLALALASSLLATVDRAPVPAAWRQALHFRWNDPRPRSETAQWRGMRARADEWARVGRALALHTRPGESIVLPNLGAIAYFTELHAYDPFGLVSPEVARLRSGPRRRASPGHDKAVPASFFFDRRPDYLGAWIAPVAAPEQAGIPPDVARLTRLERYPLEPAGDPPEELRVLRLDWSR